jgi:murein DD-endopeptidase MepM/ murein hydrolase activator NlpD
MIKDRVTILVVPDAAPGMISFRIPAWGLYALAGVVLAGLVGLGTAVFQHAAAVRSEERIAALVAENRALEGEIGAVRESVARVGGRLAELAALEREVRIAADLAAIDPEVRRVGIGGAAPAPAADLPGAAVGATSTDRMEIAAARRNIEGLLRQARFQRESLTEVAEALAHRGEALARTPSILPVPGGTITSQFGKRQNPVTGECGVHQGIDIGGERGAPVLAAAAGRVAFTGVRTGYGLTVEIDHGNGLTTAYSHNTEVMVESGQWVERGQRIASVGSSGRATAPHCHYEVRRNGTPVDPERYLLASRISFD